MGKLVTKRVEKVKALSHQYQQVFTQEDTTSFPKLGKSPYGKMPKINITTEGVEKLLKQLNPNKAVGPDMLPTQVMKDHAELITPMLSKIFQQSLDTGDVPNDWRNANITALFKKGDRTLPPNYRPLSLTSISCKLLEPILFSNIMAHYDRYGIFKNINQHGFRKRHSCETHY